MYISKKFPEYFAKSVISTPKEYSLDFVLPIVLY